MKILIVCKYKENIKSHISPFVSEQAEALQKVGCEVNFFTIEGYGLAAYFKALKPLNAKIKVFKPDVIHAHYGLCGLTANLQRRVPVVTTYHGSDINNRKSRFFSKFAIRYSAFNIFVSQKIIEIAKPGKNHILLPCGINIEEFNNLDKTNSRLETGLKQEKKYVLFASSFGNHIKDPQLAIDACKLLPNITLIEMKGFSRQEVIKLMYACDVLLLTSLTEGSPQVIKEAMACGLPIVSTDVGDVRWITNGVDGCYIVESRNATDVALLLKKALAFQGRTQGRQRILDYSLTNDIIARKLLSDVYSRIIK